MILERGYDLPGDHFTVVPNAWIRDERLSRRARGLLVELMSHRAGWQTSVESLARSGPEGEAALKTGLKELERYGYLQRDWTRDERGRRTGTKYVITDPGRPTPAPPDPRVENRPMDDEDAGPAPSGENPPVDDPLVAEPPVADPSPKKTDLLEAQRKEERCRPRVHVRSAPTGKTKQQRRSPLEELVTACHRAGLTARFDSLTPANVALVRQLVDRHGIDVLVQAARAAHRPHDPARTAAAWLGLWQSLPAPKSPLPPKCNRCDEYGWLPDDEDGHAVRCPCRRVLAA
ncbi:hypothetical protein JOJ87_001402 [Rhodococcus ruber]|uniref:helix-turn-helix domain-containing protein n=1 Tax=Rhodococcus ruber TaxID=1830 RepID=UPI001AE5A380|nr:helix-turn-helix domain-containing protein [Rhodococcus ruber]MBP2211058.1 hypothetical protein [Rhodococcus ruber]